MSSVRNKKRRPANARRNEELAFRALADPTRRLLLDALFDREARTLGELGAAVKEMTRFGVMKHLRILEAAGLVATRKIGREKFHYLNPVPIQLIHDRWVSKYTQPRAVALADLKHQLEGRNRMASSPRQVFEVYIRATPQQVWDAIIKPEFTAKYFFGSRVDTDGRAGSAIRHFAPDGTTLWGDDHIVEAEPPRRLVHSWRSLYDEELSAEPPSRVTWEIEPQAGGISKLTVIHDQLEESPKTAASVSGGWMFVISGLKTLLETGQPLNERSTGSQQRVS